MALLSRSDGATIHYEVMGEGAPLLLLAPGGVSSAIASWERAAINPLTLLAEGWRLIAMDQRHAGASLAPAAAFSYDHTVADQIAVLDAAGVGQTAIFAAGSGCLHAWRLAHDAPDRVSAIVAVEPVGLDASNAPATFYGVFNETMRVARAEGMAGVVQAAASDPVFITNPAAGPFAARLHSDPAFRDQVRAMMVESYVALMVRFRDGIWPAQPPFFTVSAAWMRACQMPMLVLPGNSAAAPEGVARLIGESAPRARVLDADWRDPDKLAATVDTIRRFLHAPE